MKKVISIKLDTKQFQHDNRLFEITPKSRKVVWTLYKRFRGNVDYRVLNDVERQVPVAVQRLKAS